MGGWGLYVRVHIYMYIYVYTGDPLRRRAHVCETIVRVCAHSSDNIAMIFEGIHARVGGCVRGLGDGGAWGLCVSYHIHVHVRTCTCM